MNNKFSINLVKILLLIGTLSMMIFACKKQEVDSVMEETKEIQKEVEKEQAIPRIDTSDIDDMDIKSILTRMDNLNQTLGETIAVSKEDFFNFRDKKICLIGDSISDCSKSSLIKYFTNIYIDSTPGREISTVMQFYNNAKKYDKLGEVVVISLGTNAINGITIDLLEQVYEKLEGRPMIMFSVVMPYNGQERNRNRDIINFINSHDNCYLADWNKTVKGHSEYFVEDKIHPNGAGGEVYAQLLLKTVAECLKER